jgi:regulatory protein
MNPKEALTRAQAICSQQEQCRQDILTRLEKWGISESVALKIVKQLEKDRFIDEMRYAISYSRDKVKFNKWGRIKICWMLRQKKIPDEIIDQALDQIDINEYELLLESELIKKKRSLKSDDQYNKKRKLIQFAIQKGFENDVVYKIVNNLFQPRQKK